jgi:hypothetical protein
LRYIGEVQYGWNHEPYWKYLDSVGHLWPPHIFRFAGSVENHDLESPNSLHDSWVENLFVREVSSAANRSQRIVQIDLSLLGPHHDRFIHLTYGGVKFYQLQMEAGPPGTVQMRNRGHGDLLVHELRSEDDGTFSHEIVFASGSVFLFRFSEFSHRIEPMDT